MNQVVEAKMNREIMVVPNKALFSDIDRETKFYPSLESDFEQKVLSNYEYMIRKEAETNLEYKQPISYWLVINDKKKIFVYKRWWSKSSAWEHRLHDKLSFWVWGHIEKEDRFSRNPIRDSFIREVEEELSIKKDNIVNTKLVWYINDDNNEVGRVHIGIAYLLEVKWDKFELLDWELDSGEFLDISEVESMIKSDLYDIDPWSRILFEPIKKILKDYKIPYFEMFFNSKIKILLLAPFFRIEGYKA